MVHSAECACTGAGDTILLAPVACPACCTPLIILLQECTPCVHPVDVLLVMHCCTGVGVYKYTRVGVLVHTLALQLYTLCIRTCGDRACLTYLRLVGNFRGVHAVAVGRPIPAY